MAEQDTALVEDDGAQLETDSQEQGAPQDDTPEPIVNLARDLGWTPKDEWHGDPEKWKPAEQFIRDGREIQQSTSRELKALREQMDRIGGVTETIVRDKVAERDAYWQAQFDKAVEDGDADAARKAASQINGTGAAPQKGPDPQVATWVAKNPWYSTDPLAQARAQEISDRLKHLPVPEQLAQVDRAIRKEFPEHFPKAKGPPATQTGAQRNAVTSNRQKGFADMPPAAKEMAIDYESRLGVKKEDFAKSYWAKNEGSRA